MWGCGIQQRNPSTLLEYIYNASTGKIPDKKRGTGAVVCICPQPGVLRENILAIPVWYL